jgi:hypothetical protein
MAELGLQGSGVVVFVGKDEAAERVVQHEGNFPISPVEISLSASTFDQTNERRRFNRQVTAIVLPSQRGQL